MRFPAPIPTPKSGGRGRIAARVGGRGVQSPPGGPPQAPLSRSESCYTEHTRIKTLKPPSLKHALFRAPILAKGPNAPKSINPAFSGISRKVVRRLPLRKYEKRSKKSESENSSIYGAGVYPGDFGVSRTANELMKGNRRLQIAFRGLYNVMSAKFWDEVVSCLAAEVTRG